MKTVAIEANRMVLRDVHFCLKVRWPDIVMLSAGDGRRGIEMIEVEAPDLVMVGANLPDGDTAELITRIREFSNVPLIVLGEEQSDMDRVRCLEVGADDCISMPFSPIELLTKVRVLLRRTWGLGLNFGEEQPFSFGDKLSINAGTREVSVSDRPVKLTPTEYRILMELAKGQGRVVSHEMLLERIWGTEYVSEVGFIKRYVYRLRQKLEAGSNKPLILSERGIGYRLSKSD